MAAAESAAGVFPDECLYHSERLRPVSLGALRKQTIKSRGSQGLRKISRLAAKYENMLGTSEKQQQRGGVDRGNIRPGRADNRFVCPVAATRLRLVGRLEREAVLVFQDTEFT